MLTGNREYQRVFNPQSRTMDSWGIRRMEELVLARGEPLIGYSIPSNLSLLIRDDIVNIQIYHLRVCIYSSNSIVLCCFIISSLPFPSSLYTNNLFSLTTSWLCSCFSSMCRVNWHGFCKSDLVLLPLLVCVYGGTVLCVLQLWRVALLCAVIWVASYFFSRVELYHFRLSWISKLQSENTLTF